MSQWAGRRVFVSGTTGFKGAWLAFWLQRQGAQVHGFALPPHTDPSLFDQLGLADKIVQHTGDLRDPGAVLAALTASRAEVVFHLAAQAIVRTGFDEPIETYQTNALGTLRLLEAVRVTDSVRAVVSVTTDKVYGGPETRAHTEDGVLGGKGPYSASKVCAEVVSAEARHRWATTRGLGLATARAGNTLGGGDWARDRLVPDCVRAVASGESVTLRNPTAVRPWQHVLDVLQGYLTLAEGLLATPEDVGGAWNFGPALGDEPDVQTVAGAVMTRLGGGDRLILAPDPDGPAEQHVLRLDASKARRQLGWRPRLDWRRSLQWAADWYRGHADGRTATELCAEQIDSYEALAPAVPEVGVSSVRTRDSGRTGHGGGGPCRHCATPLEDLLLDLGKSPLANAYVPHDKRNEPELFRPLRAYVCQECLLVQVPEFATPESIFSDYLYFSSYSTTWLEHSRALAAELVERLSLGADSRVVEVASNDGYLLRNFVEAGVPCLGIEPAANVAQVAIDAGVPTRVEFFSHALAASLRAEQGAADLIIGINVLAHVPGLNDFVAGIAELLAPGGTALLEFPHLHALLQDGLFDTIYHEHYSYFSLHAVRRVLRAAGLVVSDLQERQTHGGSLRLFVRHQDDPEAGPTAAVEAFMERERAFGIPEPSTYRQLQTRANATRKELLSFLLDAHKRGKRVVGYGAPAKGNTLLNFCGIRRDLVEFTADISPHKQGTWLPGTGIRVLSPDEVLAAKPDYVLILPWNLKDEIVEQLGAIREWGGRFVVALPTLEVL